MFETWGPTSFLDPDETPLYKVEAGGLDDLGARAFGFPVNSPGVLLATAKRIAFQAHANGAAWTVDLTKIVGLELGQTRFLMLPCLTVRYHDARGEVATQRFMIVPAEDSEVMGRLAQWMVGCND